MGVGVRRVSEGRGSIPPSCTSQNLNFPRLLPIVQGDPGVPSRREQQEGGDGYPSPVFGHNSSPPCASHILLPPLEPPPHPWASGSHLAADPPPSTPCANSSLRPVPARGGAEGHLPLRGSFRKLAVHTEARRSRGDRGGRAPDTSSLHNSPRDRVRWPSSNSRGSSTSFGRGRKRGARGPRMAPHRAPESCPALPGPARPRRPPGSPAPTASGEGKRRSAPSRLRTLRSGTPPLPSEAESPPPRRLRPRKGRGDGPGLAAGRRRALLRPAASSLPMTHTGTPPRSPLELLFWGLKKVLILPPTQTPTPGCEGTQGSHHQL